MDIDTQLPAGPGDDEHDGLARFVPDGVGHQFASEQGRSLRVGRGFAGTDGRPDLAAGLGHGGRSRLKPDVSRLQLGRIGRRHRIHRMPPCAGLSWPGRTLAAVWLSSREAPRRFAVLDMGCKENSAAICTARHRSADGFWNDDWRVNRRGRPHPCGLVTRMAVPLSPGGPEVASYYPISGTRVTFPMPC